MLKVSAEGGTGYDHAVTMARSRDLFGPYETDPAKHILTARGTDGLLLRGAQEVGHSLELCYGPLLVDRLHHCLQDGWRAYP